MVEIVRTARAAGTRLRLIGTGHSWNEICKTDGRLVSLDGMNEVLSLDESGLTVTFQGGAKIWQLNIWLHKRGFALPYNISTQGPTFVGAAATGSHSSFTSYGVLATFIEACRLVDGEGVVHVLDRQDDDWNAVCMGLGCMGIITELTVRVQRSFRMEMVLKTIPFEDVCRDYEHIAKKNDFTMVWFFPSDENNVKVHTYNYVAADAEKTAVDWKRGAESALQARGLPILYSLMGWLPKRWFDFGTRVIVKIAKPDERVVDDGWKLLCLNGYGAASNAGTLKEFPLHYETEFFVDIDKMPTVLRIVRDVIRKHQLKVDLPLFLRRVPADDIWMSHSYHRMSITATLTTMHAAHARLYFAEFEKEMLALGGRPHWGKTFYFTRAQTENMYPMLDRFKEACRRFDPDGIFTSEWTERVLGLGRARVMAKL